MLSRDGARFLVHVMGTVLACDIRGKVRRDGGRISSPVVAGDRVTVSPIGSGRGVIEEVLPRRTVLARPGFRELDHVIAANVDTVFIVDALDRPPNLRRLERYLVLAWESGARPVIALSKADQCADVADAAAAVESIAATVPVLAYSVMSGEGLGAFERYEDRFLDLFKRAE